MRSGQPFEEWRREAIHKLEGRWLGRTQGELWDELPPAERRETEERLRALVEEMEEPDRTLFLRYYYEEEPLDQVCRALQMRPSTARSRLCRGRRKLKERLTQEGGMLDAQSHP